MLGYKFANHTHVDTKWQKIVGKLKNLKEKGRSRKLCTMTFLSAKCKVGYPHLNSATFGNNRNRIPLSTKHKYNTAPGAKTACNY